MRSSNDRGVLSKAIGIANRGWESMQFVSGSTGVDDHPDSPNARVEPEFLELLRQARELSKQTPDHVIENINAVPSSTNDTSAERSHIWAEAKEAQEAGRQSTSFSQNIQRSRRTNKADRNLFGLG
ncbi:hypothetical protein PGT21_001497 [Puccinia graminis f. sp. tritici]|uniref:Uncharacterized protein n=1 Tax=Puccinia graminis f. sp. tritici TaxID=56615 RepID=A0A5B0N1I0_PUCGR|nr:hypothetical protein PGT21_001497 [Puccinia graminis f. sp. tritici]